MRKVAYYSPRPRWKGLDFKDCPIVTVPNQSMTLKDILTRFIRKQSLPVQHEGSYHVVGDTDLEKMAKADWVDQNEFLQRYKKYTKRMEKVLVDKKEQAEREALEKLKASVPSVVPPVVPPVSQ